jgi:hypothetical protein
MPIKNKMPETSILDSAAGTFSPSSSSPAVSEAGKGQQLSSAYEGVKQGSVPAMMIVTLGRAKLTRYTLYTIRIRCDTLHFS